MATLATYIGLRTAVCPTADDELRVDRSERVSLALHERIARRRCQGAASTPTRSAMRPRGTGNRTRWRVLRSRTLGGHDSVTPTGRTSALPSPVGRARLESARWKRSSTWVSRPSSSASSSPIDSLISRNRALTSGMVHALGAIRSVTSNSRCETRSRSASYAPGSPGGSVEDGVGEQFRVAEGVGDAVHGDRVLEVAGIADQRPPGPHGRRRNPRMPSKPRRRSARTPSSIRSRSSGACSPSARRIRLPGRRSPMP